MALQAAYSRYLASPSADALAGDASIHYMPTLSSINKASAIIKHLSKQEQLLKKKENILSAFESHRDLCIETEATIMFLNGGGTLLPGMDDNFLVDKTVSLPMTHIVAFDAQQKIQQVRITWDQASLLKMLDVIGSRGKNWPICDGKDQIRVLSNSIELANATSSGSQEDQPDRRQSRVGANGDKYNSLNLFQPREMADRSDSAVHPVAPKAASAKPAERDYHDLFAAGADLPRAQSPTKNNAKGGAGKNYHGNRLFDKESSDSVVASPAKKSDAKKYNHFEFGDEEDTQRPMSNNSNRHASQWNFEDFVTPSKQSSKVRDPNARQYGWSDDEDEAKKPVVERPKVPQARPDAKTHFDFNDEATPTQDKHRPTSSRAHNNMGLYEDNVVESKKQNSSATTAGPAASEKMPLGNITNQNQQRKTFGSQFEMADNSPSQSFSRPRGENLPEPVKKHANMMQASWEMRDDSPSDRGINIAGDGMGSRKKPGEKSWWDFGEN